MTKDAWDYLDPALKRSFEYKKAAKEAISKKNYNKGIENYEAAVEIIDEMFDNLNKEGITFGYGAKRSTAHTLSIAREEYIKQAEKLRNKQKRKEGGLLKRIGLGAIFLFLLSSFFLFQSYLTGNSVGSLNLTTSNWIGGILFVIGLAGAFIYLRKK